MSKSLTNPSFDYSLVSSEQKSTLLYCEGQIEKSRTRAAAEIMRHGEMLCSAREAIAESGERVFVLWLDSLGITKSSAYRAMEAFAAFGKFPSVGSFETTALYALAKNEKAKKQAVKLADKGVKVTAAMAKELIARATPKPVDVSPEPRNGEDGRKESDGHDALTEKTPRPPRNGKDKPGVDYGRCPNCAGTKWTENDEGVWCAKCHQPHGEPTGGADEERVATQRSKTVKTTEALMRAFEDLDLLSPNEERHEAALAHCRELLTIAKEWK